MKQYEAVAKAMKQNGGYATLKHLYQKAINIQGSTWKAKDPYANIRRIVQTKPLFFKIKPGLWGLTSDRDTILKRLNIDESASKVQKNNFEHNYYQGLVIEIGNLMGFKTYVPSQDKNKPFLNKKLSDLITIQNFYNFTYDELIQRAKYIDATWFNERLFPFAFFEIEHTTNIENALIKFMEFQDFRTKFFIVADSARKKLFKTKRSRYIIKNTRRRK